MMIFLAFQAKGLINKALPDLPELLTFYWQIIANIAALTVSGLIGTFLPGGGFNWPLYLGGITIFKIHCRGFSWRHNYNTNISQYTFKHLHFANQF